MDDTFDIMARRLMSLGSHVEMTGDGLQKHRSEDRRMTKMSRIPLVGMAQDSLAHIYVLL